MKKDFLLLIVLLAGAPLLAQSVPSTGLSSCTLDANHITVFDSPTAACEASVSEISTAALAVCSTSCPGCFRIDNSSACLEIWNSQVSCGDVDECTVTIAHDGTDATFDTDFGNIEIEGGFVKVGNGTFVVNDTGATAADVRIEGNGDANLTTWSTSNARVGIGTASPTVKLDVVGAITASGALTAATGTISGALTVDTSTLKVDSVNNRVGIGTASPSEDLHVYADSGVLARFERHTTSSGMLIELMNPSQKWNLGLNAAERIILRDVTNSNTDVLTVETGTPANTLYLDSSGGVGIGTNTPAYALEIDGSVTAGYFAITSGASTILAVDSSGNVTVTTSNGDVVIHADGSAQLPGIATAPFTCNSGNAGRFYHDSTNGVQCWCNGSSFVANDTLHTGNCT